MQILAHRGKWLTVDEKNSVIALNRAFRDGYGVETDVRDYNGQLVISHDVPNGLEISFIEFCEIYNSYHSPLPLALNIKSDGLQLKLKNILDKYKIHNYFVFDMSLPDTLGYLQNGITTAIRLSEYEVQNSLFDLCEYVWLDSFIDTWYSVELIDNLIRLGKKVAIVSSELHKRDHMEQWEMLKRYSLNDNVFLCTDLILEAERFFYEN